MQRDLQDEKQYVRQQVDELLQYINRKCNDAYKLARRQGHRRAAKPMYGLRSHGHPAYSDAVLRQPNAVRLSVRHRGRN